MSWKLRFRVACSLASTWSSCASAPHEDRHQFNGSLLNKFVIFCRLQPNQRMSQRACQSELEQTPQVSRLAAVRRCQAREICKGVEGQRL